MTITSAVDRHDRRLGHVRHPGRRPDDHPHHRHGGQHRRRRQRQRQQDLGRRQHPDHARPPTPTRSAPNHVLTITVNALGGTLGRRHRDRGDRQRPGQLRRLAHLQLHRRRGDGQLHRDDHLGRAGTTVVSATSDIPVGTARRSPAPPARRPTPRPAAAATPARSGSTPTSRSRPPTDTNPVGTNHVLTITVNALGGTLADGTATASIVSGPGSFVGSPTCNYTGGAATRQLHRDHHLRRRRHDGRLGHVRHRGRRPDHHPHHRHRRPTPPPAAAATPSKIWVDANIPITPATATNAVGTQPRAHDHRERARRGIAAADGTATRDASSAARAASSARRTCNYTGGGATASCTVTITSDRRRHDGGLGHARDHPGRRGSTITRTDRHRRQHRRRRQRQRQQDLGQRQHPDHARDRHQPGRHRPRAHDHGQRASAASSPTAPRRRASSAARAASSARPPAPTPAAAPAPAAP